jgi:excisionase family DNA binding protein
MDVDSVRTGGENGAKTADRRAQAALWCTRTGAARLAGCTEGAIRHAVRRGDLPAYEAADGTILIHRQDLDAWSAQRRRPRSA